MQCRRFFRAGNVKLIAAFVCILGPAELMPAQSLYSVNAIAYVDVNYVAGSNLVANPLNRTQNTISNLFPEMPDGSLFLPWDGASQSFAPTNSYSAASGWTDAGARLMRPHGGLLWLPAPRKITFTGEVPQGSLSPGQMYPAGLWVLSVMPGSGAICGNIDECPPQPPPSTTLWKLNRGTQRYETYFYFGSQPGFPSGWLDEDFNSVDPQLEPGESGLFSVPTSFSVPASPTESTQTVTSVQVRLQDVRRDGTNLTFRFALTNGIPYTVQRCVDLTVKTWQVVQQESASTSNGLATVTVVATTNDAAFYRVGPHITGPVPHLANPSRSGTQFRFQFYAPTGTVYQVQRTLSLAMPPSMSMWQTIQSVAADPDSFVTVTDTNATAPRGYYRIQY